MMKHPLCNYSHMICDQSNCPRYIIGVTRYIRITVLNKRDNQFFGNLDFYLFGMTYCDDLIALSFFTR